MDARADEAYEEEHVHQVYNKIASHFSATRYKPWPIVSDFLSGLADGAVGIDAGCGNGKYLNINQNVFIIGSDRCENLSSIAKERSPTQDAITADILCQPHTPGMFDFALSIAVVHHLSTEARRVEAISSILRLLKPAGEGKALLYVWALEQNSSRRGWDENSEQDVLVPWMLNQRFSITNGGRSAAPESGEDTQNNRSDAFLRYYHLYKKGELEQNVQSAGGTIVNSGYEKDNWWAIVERS